MVTHAYNPSFQRGGDTRITRPLHGQPVYLKNRALDSVRDLVSGKYGGRAKRIIPDVFFWPLEVHT